ncbi:TetR/AcrR family transcriptional regulator [Humibacter sp.]|uniref:TetR/AcrR family transcriptional regulator n=1 Tax=Humibacter sp. TaxID=1940291 RepID=UPI003F810214
MAQRMRGADRRSQVLEIAAREFAQHGLHGASTEAIAREAGITQAYIFRMFGTKKALFLELVTAAFDRVSEGMLAAGNPATTPTGLDALSRMGARYYDQLENRTSLLLQLQGFAACSDPEVRAAVRGRVGHMWQVVADTTGLDAVTVKSFLAFGMLLNAGAAIDVDEVDEPWADGIRTRIQPGLFEHITAETNR